MTEPETSDRNVADILRRKVSEFADVGALEVVGGRSFTYGELDGLSSRLANALIDEGIEPGDRVSVGFGNDDGDHSLVSYFGIQKAGAVFVPISTRAAAAEVAWQLDHSGTRLLLAARDLQSRWGGALSDELPRWSADEIVARSDRAAAEDPNLSVGPSDTAEVIYTSGTTGMPKGVQVPHGALIAFRESQMSPLFQRRRFPA